MAILGLLKELYFLFKDQIDIDHAIEKLIKFYVNNFLHH